MAATKSINMDVKLTGRMKQLSLFGDSATMDIDEVYKNELDSKIDSLNKQNQRIYEKQEQVDTTLALVQERMQENSRSFLIDAHHKFCYKYNKIDDLNLQSIERRYLYYKTAGGDTFIDHLMEEIRSLPRVTLFTDEV